MRKLLALAAALLLFPAAASAQVYSPGQQGTIGAVVTATDLNGNAIKAILPAVSGATAAGGAQTGNPVPMGCDANTTSPLVTTGTRDTVQCGLAGSLKTELALPGSQNSNNVVNGAFGDGRTNTVTTYEFAVKPETFNGTTWDKLRGDVNGAVNQPWALAASRWNYAAAASGIVNTTTAVTISAAAGAGVRNYLTSCQISHDTLSAVTEFVVRDGAAGTVLYRTKLQTTAVESEALNFGAPLKGTANTLMEAAALTAVTGGVYLNCQGFTGS